jgi:hypothetical protein
MWVWVLGAALLGVAGVCVSQYRAANRSYVPLSKRQPSRGASNKKPALGHEALDMTGVYRTQRIHQGLERTTMPMPRLFTRKNTPEDDIINPEGLALPDDETYSARYHTAFHKTKSKDQTK